MFKHLGVALVVLLHATGVAAGEKKRIEKAADLPRFSYEIEGKLENLVRDAARFRQFAAQVRRDDESVLAQYDIADKAAQRQLLGVLAQLDFLEGRYQAADQRALEIRSLEEKPADKLISGMQLRAWFKNIVAEWTDILMLNMPTGHHVKRSVRSSGPTMRHGRMTVQIPGYCFATSCSARILSGP
jgi:ATPase subunit of ABC transporter with duplicated ATPase domains